MEKILNNLNKHAFRKLIKEQKLYNEELKFLLKEKIDKRDSIKDGFDVRIDYLRYMIQCIDKEIEIMKDEARYL